MTLVEVVVALLILTTGLLGAVAANAASARLIADGHRLTRLAAAATSLLDELHDGCVASDGARVVAPFRFEWTVRRASPVVEIRLTAAYDTGAGARQLGFVLGRWCP